MAHRAPFYNGVTVQCSFGGADDGIGHNINLLVPLTRSAAALRRTLFLWHDLNFAHHVSFLPRSAPSITPSFDARPYIASTLRFSFRAITIFVFSRVSVLIRSSFVHCGCALPSSPCHSPCERIAFESAAIVTQHARAVRPSSPTNKDMPKIDPCQRQQKSFPDRW
jgi:hypothetical protein